MRSVLAVVEKPLRITGHVLDRLRERLPGENLETEKAALHRVEELLRESRKQEINDVVRVRRIINNNFTRASYFYNRRRDLRFVVIEEDDEVVVVTVERPSELFIPAPLVSAGDKNRRRRRMEQKERHRKEYSCAVGA